MGKIIQRLGQSNIDVTLQTIGSIDSIVKLCNENNINNLDVVGNSFSFTDGEIINKNNTGLPYSTQNKDAISIPSCSIPSGLNFNFAELKISWDSSSVIGYEYWISSLNVTPTGSGNFTESTSFDVSSLVDGNIYYFFIRSVCSFGFYSDIESLEVDFPPIVPVTSGLIAEYFASYGLDVLAGKVTKWNDLSGNGNHLFDFVLNQPIYQDSSIGTERTVYFDGTNGIRTSSNLVGVLATQAITIMCVLKYPNSPSSVCALDYSSGSYSGDIDGFASYFYDGAGSKIQLLLKGNAGVSSGSMITLNDNAQVFTLIPDKSQPLGLEIDILKKNNTSGFVVTDSHENTNAFGSHKFAIGAQNNSTNKSKMNLGCLLVWNRRLSPTEQTSVYNYLKAKYSL